MGTNENEALQMKNGEQKMQNIPHSQEQNIRVRDRMSIKIPLPKHKFTKTREIQRVKHS